MSKTTNNFWSQWLAKRVVKPLHASTVSNRRIRQLHYHLNQILPSHPLVGLDVGSGSGELAFCLVNTQANLEMIGVDVLVRENPAIEVVEFDGEKLPFPDKSYDFVMLVDVLHHTHHPQNILQECVRVSRQFILVKDHVCNSNWDRIRLSFMDWVGNRGYNVHLPYNYLSKRQWNNLYEKTGLWCEEKIERLNLYPQPFSLIFDSSLHFIAKLSLS